MKTRSLLVAAALIGACGLAAPALAHHSVNAQFDAGKEDLVTGVLTKIEVINPHSQWDFTAKNAKGGTDAWHFESASPAVLRRGGVRVKEDIKVGDTYVIHYNPSLDGSHTGYMRGIEINGKLANINQLVDVRPTD